MPPPTLVCYVCGREFGTRSLLIHQEQCKKKWLDREALKPPKDRLPLPEPPKEIKVGASREEANEAAMETFKNEGLVACEWCGRKFLQESCTQDNPARRVGEPTKVKCNDQTVRVSAAEAAGEVEDSSPVSRAPPAGSEPPKRPLSLSSSERSTGGGPSPAPSPGRTAAPSVAAPASRGPPSRATESSRGESSASKKITRAVDFAAVVEDCADASSIDATIVDILEDKCNALEGVLAHASEELQSLRDVIASLRKART